MQSRFKSHIQEQFPFLLGNPILVACSGGLDSVVLAHLCSRLGLEITLAHCNFNLRGEESDGDEAFVRGLAKNLDVDLRVKSFDTNKYVQTHKGSVQMAARKLRYDWFTKLLEKEGFHAVLTAHHADDALETFLINLSRGTGIDGLTGIPIRNGNAIRPLLPFSRQEILDFAKAEKLAWREDSSNAETKYLRNKIRHEVVPKLKELHPTFLENFGQTQEHLRQTSSLTENYLAGLKSQLFRIEEEQIRISIDELRQLRPLEAHLYGLFEAYGFTEWDDLKVLLTGMSGKEVHSKSHRLLKDREDLILKARALSTIENVVIPEKTAKITEPLSLRFEQVTEIENDSMNTIFVDKEKLNYPLLLRNWEKGDYFYPFGMQGKKKLSKFYKDEKMDVFSKEKQWLLCSGDSIVWVVGRRLDDRFKVEASTQQILKITLLV